MGVEYSYQALPVGSTLLARSLVEPAFGEWLQFPHWWWDGPPWRDHDPHVQAFVQEARALLALHPGLDQRFCAVDRCWDVLHYLLSPNRRHGVRDDPDVGTLAIRGTAPLAAHLRSTQGFPIRYTPPDQIQLVCSFLEPFSRDLVLEQFEPQRIARDTYKGYGYSNEPELVWSYFAALRRFYQQACAHTEGVLVLAS